MFPLAIDIVVSLSLFVSRHSFAERGLSPVIVGSIAMIYGAIYIFSSLVMGRIIKAHLAKLQMNIGLALIIAVLCLLANVHQTVFVLLIFGFLPFSTSLFFNAFQSYMLNVETAAAQSLSRSVGLYTFAWSIGFAVGPILSAVVKDLFSWSWAYYTAAFITLVVGMIALNFKPVEGKTTITAPVTGPEQEPALPLSGWLGILIGFTGWIVITTFWPVQAATAHFSTVIKGGVEFAFAITQALTALVVSLFGGWYHKPKSLLLVAGFGVAGIFIFALCHTPWFFILGSSLFGIYTGVCFVYLVYHAMLDREKSIKRVAVNEITVGATFLIGPVIGNSLLGCLQTVGHAYMAVGVMIAVGAIIQWLVTRFLLKKYRAHVFDPQRHQIDR